MKTLFLIWIFSQYGGTTKVIGKWDFYEASLACAPMPKGRTLSPHMSKVYMRLISVGVFGKCDATCQKHVKKGFD